MKYDYITNSHHITYTFFFKRLGECTFLNLWVKELGRIARLVSHSCTKCWLGPGMWIYGIQTVRYTCPSWAPPSIQTNSDRVCGFKHKRVRNELLVPHNCFCVPDLWWRIRDGSLEQCSMLWLNVRSCAVFRWAASESQNTAAKMLNLYYGG